MDCVILASQPEADGGVTFLYYFLLCGDFHHKYPVPPGRECVFGILAFYYFLATHTKARASADSVEARPSGNTSVNQLPPSQSEFRRGGGNIYVGAWLLRITKKVSFFQLKVHFSCSLCL